MSCLRDLCTRAIGESDKEYSSLSTICTTAYTVKVSHDSLTPLSTANLSGQQNTPQTQPANSTQIINQTCRFDQHKKPAGDLFLLLHGETDSISIRSRQATYFFFFTAPLRDAASQFDADSRPRRSCRFDQHKKPAGLFFFMALFFCGEFFQNPSLLPSLVVDDEHS